MAKISRRTPSFFESMAVFSRRTSIAKVSRFPRKRGRKIEILPVCSARGNLAATKRSHYADFGNQSAEFQGIAKREAVYVNCVSAKNSVKWSRRGKNFSKLRQEKGISALGFASNPFRIGFPFHRKIRYRTDTATSSSLLVSSLPCQLSIADAQDKMRRHRPIVQAPYCWYRHQCGHIRLPVPDKGSRPRHRSLRSTRFSVFLAQSFSVPCPFPFGGPSFIQNPPWAVRT